VPAYRERPGPGVRPYGDVLGFLERPVSFVTRHPGARDWAAEEGFSVGRVIDHLDLDPAQIEPGDRVIGLVPVNLAAEVCERGGAYLHLTLALPPELRGRELSAQQIRAHDVRIEQYSVRRVSRTSKPGR
jgi:CRISPR-associated protein Csx16